MDTTPPLANGTAPPPLSRHFSPNGCANFRKSEAIFRKKRVGASHRIIAAGDPLAFVFHFHLGLYLIRSKPNASLKYALACAMAAPSSEGLSDFKALTRLNIGADSDQRGLDKFEEPTLLRLKDELDGEIYLQFLCLPNLQDVEMNLPNVKDFHKSRTLWPQTLLPDAAKLRTLILPQSMVSPRLLRHVFSCAPNPARLEYDCSIFIPNRLTRESCHLASNC